MTDDVPMTQDDQAPKPPEPAFKTLRAGEIATQKKIKSCLLLHTLGPQVITSLVMALLTSIHLLV